MADERYALQKKPSRGRREAVAGEGKYGDDPEGEPKPSEGAGYGRHACKTISDAAWFPFGPEATRRSPLGLWQTHALGTDKSPRIF
jgi:hypothetical protein